MLKYVLDQFTQANNMSRERKQPRFGPGITEYITLWSYTGNCMVI